VEVFFARPVLRMLIQQPLVAANRGGQYDVTCTVSGGGLSGQAGAVRHGLAKALTYFEPELRGCAEARRVPDPRSARGRTQEVRPGKGAALVPVLEALVAHILHIVKGAPCGAPFLFAPFRFVQILANSLTVKLPASGRCGAGDRQH
jgi:hypothetical protein